MAYDSVAGAWAAYGRVAGDWAAYGRASGAWAAYGRVRHMVGPLQVQCLSPTYVRLRNSISWPMAWCYLSTRN